MSVVLETGMVRSFLHRLIDRLVDDLEATAESIARRPPRAESTRPRITLDEKAEEPKRAKPAPVTGSKTPKRAGRQPRGDVLVGCGRRNKSLAVLLRLSETVSERLGLGPGGACDCQVEQVGKALVLRPGRGVRAWRQPAGRQFLLRIATAGRWGPLGPHPSEVCAWHFDLENRLVIQAPAWLPAAAAKAPVVASRPQVRSKKNNSKAKAEPSVSCKKMAGTNPAIKCSACQKAMATVECSLCPTLLCDDCWDPHVRKHWHTAVTSPAPAGHAAELGK